MLKTIARNKINKVLTKRFYSSTWEEIRIPVPWGHVAGKWWGPQHKRPILATHGWQDNAGTFDTLIPLLPEATSVLAVDFPGCGYSSKLPPGVFYHIIDMVILTRRIVKHFNWQKVSFLGHSLGALNNYIYNMLYPNEVEFLVSLDALLPHPQDPKAVEHMGKDVDNFLKYDALNSLNKEPPCFSFQELEQKLHNSMKFVDLDKCRYILDRNIKPSSKDPSKFYISVDPRLKVHDLIRWSEEELLANANRVRSPILLLKVDNSPFFKKEKEFTTKAIGIIKNNNSNFNMHTIEGSHHVHLNNPERLEKLINEFLNKFDVGDRSESGFNKGNLTVQNA